jgi:hypothetical protein
MSLEEQILLTIRSTQVLRVFLVGSYLPILSVLYSVVCIIVSPFVIYFLAIALCVFRFTDCDYSFGIFKLNKTSEYIIDLGNTDIFWKRMVDLYAAFLESFFFQLTKQFQRRFHFYVWPIRNFNFFWPWCWLINWIKVMYIFRDLFTLRF